MPGWPTSCQSVTLLSGVHRLSDILDREPAYVPPGYSLRRRFANGVEPGFGLIKDQALLVYTTGWSLSDWTYPLMFCVAGPGAPELFATEQRKGTQVPLGIGVTGEYHDGIWVASMDEFGNPAGRRWQVGGTHSITIRNSLAVLAARGPRQLPASELGRMLSSFPL
jgi:hypothetical protein